MLSKLLGSLKVIARFRREIDLSKRIAHPNVLHIYDVFELPPRKQDGDLQVSSPCMVMEYLEGETWPTVGRGSSDRAEEARGMVIQMALALAAAHDAEVVHRDLKPDNIFLVPRMASPPG